MQSVTLNIRFDTNASEAKLNQKLDQIHQLLADDMDFEIVSGSHKTHVNLEYKAPACSCHPMVVGTNCNCPRHGLSNAAEAARGLA